MLFARGAAELWSGRFGEAARVLDAGVTAAAASGEEHERIDCLGHLALAEALRGHLARAAELAGEATAAARATGSGRKASTPGLPRSPRSRGCTWSTMSCGRRAAGPRAGGHRPSGEPGQADRGGRLPDSRIQCPGRGARRSSHAVRGQGTIGLVCSVMARAEAQPGRVARRWRPPASIEAALAAAKRADCDGSPEAAVTLAHAWVAAGEGDNALRALAPVLAAHEGVPEWVRVQACLVDARLGYHCGDRVRGRRSLGCALRLAEREQLRLPFAMERSWIGLVLQRDLELAGAHQHLLRSAGCHDPLPAASQALNEAAIPVIEPLTEREQEVLRHVSVMLTTAEIASELYISTNTVKSHIKNICHKLAVTHRGEAVRRARLLQLI